MRRRLPLFVLPTVLFPGAVLPLHVFEPRYRQMVARCLEFDRRFGLLFHSDDLYGPFEVDTDRVGCVAEIRSFQPLPDGRSLMMTEGIERFRIADRVEVGQLYYEALVDEYLDRQESEVGLIVRRQRSIELFEAVLRRLSVERGSLRELDPRREISFALASTIVVDPAWQQELLELQRETDRLDQIDHLLRAVRDG